MRINQILLPKFLLAIIFISISPLIYGKQINGIEVELPGLRDTVERCESNIEFWKTVKLSVPEYEHLLTCFISKDSLDQGIVDENEINRSLFTKNVQVYIVTILKAAINRNFDNESFDAAKKSNRKNIIDYEKDLQSQIKDFESKKEKIQSLSNTNIDIKHKVITSEFMKDEENIQSWLEIKESSIKSKSKTSISYRAHVLVKGKIISLYITAGDKDTKAKLIEKGSDWANLILQKN